MEEAAFFVREFDAASGSLTLSDRIQEPLDPANLHLSPRDGALLCRVKRDLEPAGLLARFTHAAQAALLDAVEETADGAALRLGGRQHRLPAL